MTADPWWYDEIRAANTTALHFEQQPSYTADADVFGAWQADPATTVLTEPFHVWNGLVRGRIATGVRFERLRILEDPPTPYQRFEGWLAGVHNIPAGEVVMNTTRSPAIHEILQDLWPWPHLDYWLLDSARLLLLPFNDEGEMQDVDVSTDASMVTRAAQAWEALTLTASVQDS